MTRNPTASERLWVESFSCFFCCACEDFKPLLPVHAASASDRSCRSNNGSLPEAAWHSPSFPTSTTDATAESRTCPRFPAFAVTRLPRPALHAASLRDESRWSPPCIRGQWFL